MHLFQLAFNYKSPNYPSLLLTLHILRVLVIVLLVLLIPLPIFIILKAHLQAGVHVRVAGPAPATVRRAAALAHMVRAQVLPERGLPLVALVARVTHILGVVRVARVHVPLVVAVVLELLVTGRALELQVGIAHGIHVGGVGEGLLLGGRLGEGLLLGGRQRLEVDRASGAQRWVIAI